MSSTITASVQAPEGLPIRVLLTCEPRDLAEFHAVVEACGGPRVFTYFSSNTAHATLADGTRVMVSAPDQQAVLQPMAPSIANLQEASRR